MHALQPRELVEAIGRLTEPAAGVRTTPSAWVCGHLVRARPYWVFALFRHFERDRWETDFESALVRRGEFPTHNQGVGADE